jgi:glycosyltransferase involved in cell wall biosynthesis
MRILHIIGNLEIGGAELMLKRLVESHQGNLHYRHTVISLSAIGQVGLKLQAIGVEVIALNMRSAWDVPLALWRLRRIIRQARPDIVQTWMYHADLLGGLAARVSGYRNIVWNIRTSALRQSRNSLTQLIILLCAKSSRFLPAAIICCGEKAREVHLNLGYDKDKFEIVPNGYDLSSLTRSASVRERLREKLVCNDKELLIGVCGRFDPLKDYRNFIEAASLVARQLDGVRFVMIGRNCDSNNAQLRDWLDDFNLSDRFILLGERGDVPDLMSALDVFCLSSKAEGFPNVVCEAMAMSTPCVVTRAGEAEFIVGTTGFTVPTESAVELAGALLRMCRLPQQTRTELGTAARKRVEDNFSISKVADRYVSVYANVLTK